MRGVVSAFACVAALAAGAFAQQPPPGPAGLRSPGDDPSAPVMLDSQACDIAERSISSLGLRDDDPDPLASAKEQIIWESRLEAGVAQCDWGEFRTRIFGQGPFIEFIGFSARRDFAAVKGGFYVGPLVATDGACFLQKTDESWTLLGCEITGGA